MLHMILPLKAGTGRARDAEPAPRGKGEGFGGPYLALLNHPQ